MLGLRVVHKYANILSQVTAVLMMSTEESEAYDLLYNIFDKMSALDIATVVDNEETLNDIIKTCTAIMEHILK